jgi:hypothetical protein
MIKARASGEPGSKLAHPVTSVAKTMLITRYAAIPNTTFISFPP